MARICACGCGASLARRRVDALWASEACRKRGRRAERADKARKRSGLQVSYRKAVGAVCSLLEVLDGEILPGHELLAQSFMAEALSPAQRERLEAAEGGAAMNRRLVDMRALIAEMQS